MRREEERKGEQRGGPHFDLGNSQLEEAAVVGTTTVL
jgi:hypothetical protein